MLLSLGTLGGLALNSKPFGVRPALCAWHESRAKIRGEAAAVGSGSLDVLPPQQMASPRGLMTQQDPEVALWAHYCQDVSEQLTAVRAPGQQGVDGVCVPLAGALPQSSPPRGRDPAGRGPQGLCMRLSPPWEMWWERGF